MSKDKIEGKAPHGATTSLKPVQAAKASSVNPLKNGGSNMRGKQGAGK